MVDADNRQAKRDDTAIQTWEAMQKMLDSGERGPTHLRGWKPGKGG